jgi:hypothetical protein
MNLIYKLMADGSADFPPIGIPNRGGIATQEDVTKALGYSDTSGGGANYPTPSGNLSNAELRLLVHMTRQ